MTFQKDQDPEQGFNQRIPGTGGDFIDGQDVEGHLRGPRQAVPEPENAARRQALPDETEDDVEGHLRVPRQAVPEPDGLYSSPTSGQGEYIRRGPDDNPHGER